MEDPNVGPPDPAAYADSHSAAHGPEQELFTMNDAAEEIETKIWLDDTHLKCSICQQWRPKSGVMVTQDLPLAGDWCYTYKCAACTAGNEFFEFLPRSWMDIVQIVIYNLRLRREEELIAEGSPVEKDKMYFRFKEDICHFIDKNWNRVCFGKSRTVTWNNTIGSSLSSHPELFVSGYNFFKQSGYWSSRSPNNPTIGAGGVTVERPKRVKERKAPAVTADGAKDRKASKKKRRPAEVNPWAEKRPKSKTKKKTNKIPKAALLPFIPGPRFYEPDGKYRKMCMAKENSARQIKIEADLLTVENEKGYRMARACYGAAEGSWFFEVVINKHNGNTRLGWSTEKGDLQAPVGYDEFSFSYRDKEGTLFHRSRPQQTFEPYGPGDVIGFFISLPPLAEQQTAEQEPKAEGETLPLPEAETQPRPKPASGASDGGGPGDTSPRGVVVPAIPGFEEPPKPGPILKGSEIRFYKNGRSSGPVFVDKVPAGTYYPAGSMFNSASVTFNFGPDFTYPPTDVPFSWAPCSRLVQVFDEAQERRRAEEEAAAQARREAEAAAAAQDAQMKTSMPNSPSPPAAVSPSSSFSFQPSPSSTFSWSNEDRSPPNPNAAQAPAAMTDVAPPAATSVTLPSTEATTQSQEQSEQHQQHQQSESPSPNLSLSSSSASIALLLNPTDDESMDVEPTFAFGNQQ